MNVKNGEDKDKSVNGKCRYQKDIHSEYHWIPYPVSVRFLHTVSIPSNVPKMHQNKHSRPVQDTPIAQK